MPDDFECISRARLEYRDGTLGCLIVSGEMGSGASHRTLTWPDVSASQPMTEESATTADTTDRSGWRESRRRRRLGGAARPV